MIDELGTDVTNFRVATSLYILSSLSLLLLLLIEPRPLPLIGLMRNQPKIHTTRSAPTPNLLMLTTADVAVATSRADTREDTMGRLPFSQRERSCVVGRNKRLLLLLCNNEVAGFYINEMFFF